MTHREPDQKYHGFLRWLGLAPDGRADATPIEPRTPSSADTQERRRRQLLADIGNFLLTHKLDVTPFTLAIAHDAIDGADQTLARHIEQHVAARHPITLEWLEQISRDIGRMDGMLQLSTLMQRLEHGLAEFGSTTSAARSATSDYNSALEAHAGELRQIGQSDMVIAQLTTLTQTMLDRTREIESKLHRSELQTRALRSRLEDARKTAELDHLTGLPNRRAFETALARELHEARLSREPLCVAFCDIDHFKRISDQHGHEAGDRVLKVVAQALARISNDRCHVARHGGEEFVVLLRGKTLGQAWETLDSARAQLAERRLVNRATDVAFGRITFSGGLADVLAHESPRHALKAADEALYQAKNTGRNRIVKSRHPA
ncbi:MAG: GGDEF domain-containing protein [Novosphingobium sp.]